MRTHHPRTREVRTERFNLPVCRHSPLRCLFQTLVASPSRLHRYRNLSTKMLENALDELDCKPCA
jgi:hypothetical protein